MIKANELRIGNILLDVESNEKYYITGEDIHQLEYGGQSGKDYEPVTLDASTFDSCHTGDRGIPIRNGGWIVFDELQWVHIKQGDTILRVTCGSLHELQNLYFALTGNELSINL